MRRQGYAFSRNLLHKGASVVAATFPARVQGRKFAIGIAGPTERIEEHRARYVALLLRETATADSR